MLEAMIVTSCHTCRAVAVAWFSFDAENKHKEVSLTNSNMTATCRSFDDRLVLGSVGFSRGVHYWEIVIDRFVGDCDPSFGIARVDVAKDQRIGASHTLHSQAFETRKNVNYLSHINYVR